MILECPSCGTYYDTPAIIPPEGRKVRCAKCANAWLAMPSPSETSEAPDEPELSESERDIADSSAQAIAEPDDDGEAAVNDEPAEDESSEEVATGEQTDEPVAIEIDEPPESTADEQTDAEFSAVEEELEATIGDAPATEPDEVAAEDAAVDAEMGAASEALPEGVGEAAASGESVDKGGPEGVMEDGSSPLLDESTAEVTAADAELAAHGDAPEQFVADDEAELEDAALASELEPDLPQAEDDAPDGEDAVDGAEGGVPEAEDEEQPPPEADYPIGDFSHQGMGPARSPMQEILAAAADSHGAEPESVEAASGEAPGDDQPQAAGTEDIGGEETEIVASAAEPATAEISSLEAAEPAPGSLSDGEIPASAIDTEMGVAEPQPDAEAGDHNAIAGQPPMAAAGAALGKDFQPSTRQLVSWGALALLVVIGFVLAVVNREAIVRTMPGSASFYSGLGMAVNLRGLDFENVTSTWTMEAEQPVLEVRGEIVNISDGQMAVPTVVFALHDEDGVEVHQWEAEVAKEPLEAGGRTQFSARIPSPPASSKSVQVKFAKAP